MKKIIESGEKIYEAIVVIFFIMLVLCSSLQVVARYILRISIPWTEEMARYCLVMFTMLGAALVSKRGAHLGAFFFVNRAKGRVKVLLYIFSTLMGMIFMAVMLGGAIIAIPRLIPIRAVTVSWINSAWLYVPLAISAALMLIMYVQDMILCVRRLISGKTDDLLSEVSRPTISETTSAG